MQSLILYQAVRVNNRERGSVANILNRQIQSQGGLSGSGLAHDAKMVVPILLACAAAM
jgi:hypothetical protein